MKHILLTLLRSIFAKQFKLAGIIFKASLQGRKKEFHFRINGRPIRALDGPSLISQIDEIYLRDFYSLPNTGKLRVLDCGANIGMVANFIASNYPDSEVECYEADPKIHMVLSSNLAGLENA